MPVQRPCPKCQKPLDVPQPTPDKVQCGHCGAVIKFKKDSTPSINLSSADQWYTVQEGKPREGPFTLDQLKAQLRDGKLRNHDLVWRQGFAAWQAVGTVPELNVVAPVAIQEPVPIKKAKEATKTGVLTYLHAVIPKPMLFGMYGALGGVLGLLLVGELVWFLLHPTPIGFEPLTIGVSPELIVYPGTRNKFTVKINRLGFEGAVKLEMLDLPAEVEVSEGFLTADQKEVELELTASQLVELAERDVRVRATALEQDKITSEEKLVLKIRAMPPTVQVQMSPIVTVYAGGQNRFGFILARQGFEGPVRIELLDQPAGVQIPLVVVPDKTTKGEIAVNVAKDAKVGNYILEAEVRYLANHKVASRATIQLNVEPPPGKLQLAASPSVTVFPGTKNRFIVKVARQDFAGAIKLEVTGGPRNVQFSNPTIDRDKSEMQVEVFAPQDVLGSSGPQTYNLRVNGKALIPEDITGSVPFQLKIEPPPPTLQLALSPKVSVYPGGKATFGVKISRQRFNGPVRVDAQPFGFVSIPPITIPPDQTDGTMEVNVNTGALGMPLNTTTPVSIVARSLDGRAVASENLKIEMLAPPSDLQITVSPTVDVYQAGRCQFTVKVARTGFLGPVQIRFNNVPTGVKLSPGDAFGNDLILNGQATMDAQPKTYEIDIVGTGQKAPDGKVPSVTKKFNLTVKAFDPKLKPPLDIVFVLDVTNSMDPQIQGIRNGIGQFVQALRDRELEARIGMVAFRDIIFDDVPFELLKFKGEHFTTDTNAYSTEVGKLKAMGGGDDPESSLDAIVKAANYPFRADALKILLLVTDEPPQTKGNSVKMAAAQQMLRDKNISQMHLIVTERDLPTYRQLQEAVKGGFFDLKKSTQQPNGFASLLPILSKQIMTTIGAPVPVAKGPPQPESAPPPSAPVGEKPPTPRAESSPESPRPQVPEPPRSGEVTIVPSAAPRPPEADDVSPPHAAMPTLKGVQSMQMYRDEDKLRLLLAIALWTAAMAAGIALTLVGAQKRYLRQAWLSIGETIKTLAMGVGAGLLAGVIGQWFYQSTPQSPTWNEVSRVLAWAILGGLIGVGMSLFVPNLSRRRAFLGGSIGGFVGALGFTLVSRYADAFLGRLIGALLLGFCIGVMVALIEIVSRRYWLEVAFGEREIRTVNLGPSTVALGGDEALAGVYVPNAAPRALGFRVDKNRVYCEDFATGKMAEVTPGESRGLAAVKIKVCSAASAKKTGANLQLVVVRDLPLMEGMPLTSEDIPGLEPQGADGIVALVSRRPKDPKVFLLRNRSKQPWLVKDPDGKQRKVEPGMSVELSTRCEIDFGQVKGVLDPTQVEQDV